MQCPNCYQLTDEGKFCTNCGASLSKSDSTVTPAVAATSEEDSSLPVPSEATSKEPSNEFVDKFMGITDNFGNFFLTLLKKPSEAKKANEKDLISGIISLSLYALLFVIGYFIMINSIDQFFATPPTFTTGFLWPFLKFLVLFTIIIAITFVGLKLAGSEVTFSKTVAKYGAYLIPFLLLLVVGYFLSLISLASLGIIAILISLLGVILIVPTLILSEVSTPTIDHIYLLVIMYVVNIFVFSFILRSIILSLMNLFNPFGGF